MADNENIIVYFHICCIGEWKMIVQKLLDRIRSSGLYDKVLEIRISILGDDSDGGDGSPLLVADNGKIKQVFHSMDMNLREHCTIQRIYDDVLLSMNSDYKILYIHSKGVGYTNGLNPFVEDWTEYLTYFNIDKHEECIHGLNNGYDAVGVNLQDQPVLHYSGNFWWSHAQHILRLGRLNDYSYNGPEFYLTKCINAKFLGLWISHINHYYDRYPPEMYTGKKMQYYVKLV
jgi:hypothetical protein